MAFPLVISGFPFLSLYFLITERRDFVLTKRRTQRFWTLAYLTFSEIDFSDIIKRAFRTFEKNSNYVIKKLVDADNLIFWSTSCWSSNVLISFYLTHKECSRLHSNSNKTYLKLRLSRLITIFIYLNENHGSSQRGTALPAVARNDWMTNNSTPAFM